MDLEAVQALAQMPYIDPKTLTEKQHMSSSMSFEDACEMARKLTSQKVKLSAIRQQLEAAGYRAGRTGTVPSLSMVSQMAHWHERDKLKNKKSEARQEKRDMKKAESQAEIKLVNPNSEMITMLKTVTKDKTVPAETRMKLVELLLKNA